MKLYLISQNENDDYDTYDSFVVAAFDSEDAKHVIELSKDTYGDWAFTHKAITVKELGTAIEGTARGKILGSFNAG